MTKNPNAVALGKLTSPKKAESSRQNGKKGGRPKERASAFGDKTTKSTSGDICQCGHDWIEHEMMDYPNACWHGHSRAATDPCQCEQFTPKD